MSIRPKHSRPAIGWRRRSRKPAMSSVLDRVVLGADSPDCPVSSNCGLRFLAGFIGQTFGSRCERETINQQWNLSVKLFGSRCEREALNQQWDLSVNVRIMRANR